MVLCQYNFFKRNIQPLYILRILHPALNDRKTIKYYTEKNILIHSLNGTENYLQR